MPHKTTLDSRHSIDACAFQLHSWKPFFDSDPPKPYSNPFLLSKRPCLSDRTTSFSIDASAIDLSRLSLLDESAAAAAASPYHRRGAGGSLKLIARKRRRGRGSRSVSGRSSDRSGTRRCCSAGAASAAAAHGGTCSDFPVAVGTDSSGELFGNGDANWASDVSEKNLLRRERERVERENLGGGFGQFGNFDAQGNESGYGSEPGYRGDAEFGYGDEFDEEEEDVRLMFWDHQFGDTDSKMEMVGENTFSDQKAHHRGRRKKHDCRVVDSLR